MLITDLVDDHVIGFGEAFLEDPDIIILLGTELRNIRWGMVSLAMQ